MEAKELRAVGIGAMIDHASCCMSYRYTVATSVAKEDPPPSTYAKRGVVALTDEQRAPEAGQVGSKLVSKLQGQLLIFPKELEVMKLAQRRGEEGVQFAAHHPH